MSDAAQPDGFAAYETWLGTPLPADPIEAMRILRHQAEQEVERLLAFLDATDGEADMEGELASFEGVQDGREGEDTDAEPSLGWPVLGPAALDGLCYDIDVELDEADAEPFLASPESVKALECSPDLWHGWEPPAGIRRSGEGRQTHWARGNSADVEGDAHEDDEDGGDHEPSLGAANPQPGGDVGIDQGAWAYGGTDDLENEVDGREDGGDTEPNGDEQDTDFAEDERNEPPVGGWQPD